MTDSIVLPLDSLNKRSDELIAKLLGLDERKKQCFERLGEPMRQLIRESQKESNNAG